MSNWEKSQADYPRKGQCPQMKTYPCCFFVLIIPVIHVTIQPNIFSLVPQKVNTAAGPKRTDGSTIWNALVGRRQVLCT